VLPGANADESGCFQEKGDQGATESTLELGPELVSNESS